MIAIALALAGAVAAALLPVRASTLSSQMVQLDPSFGVGGERTVDLGGPLWEDEPFGLVRQPDGKYIVSGKAMNQRTGNFDWAIMRFTAQGSLDPTFGWAGIVMTDFLGGHDEALRLALQPDGKIVAVGFAGQPGTEAYAGCQIDCIHVLTDLAVVRYNANGSRDTNFGWGGYVTLDFLGGKDNASGVAIQPDGKIVVGGAAARSSTDTDFGLVRFNPNGSRDTTFGWNGIVMTAFSGGVDAINNIVLQPDGKIVGVGLAQSATHGSDFALARYNPNGSLDTTFGWVGRVMTDFSGANDVAYPVMLQPDGKILVGGLTYSPGASSPDMALARYNTNGSLDTSFATFGKPGVVATDFSGNYDQILWLQLQPDSKIVAVGHTVSATTGFDFALARFNPNGTLDATFANGGRFSLDWFTKADGIHAGVLEPDGKVTVAGDAANPSTNGDDFALARFLLADPSWIEGVVSALPAASFSGATQATIIADLQGVAATIAADDAASSVAGLTALRTHVDGCPASPDADDWITDCAAQTQVRGLIDQVVSKLGGP